VAPAGARDRGVNSWVRAEAATGDEIVVTAEKRAATIRR
jgi:hypothetical protein